MGKLYVVKFKSGVKFYQSEASFLKANSGIKPDGYSANVTVEVYDCEPNKGTLYNIINSIKTSNHRDKRIESLSNPDIKIISDIRSKFNELATEGYHKRRLIFALSNCDNLKRLKSLLSSNRREFLEIEDYDWYFMILKINNFKEEHYGDNLGRNEKFKKAKEDIKEYNKNSKK